MGEFMSDEQIKSLESRLKEAEKQNSILHEMLNGDASVVEILKNEIQSLEQRLKEAELYLCDEHRKPCCHECSLRIASMDKRLSQADTELSDYHLRCSKYERLNGHLAFKVSELEQEIARLKNDAKV
jgi:DNA-binding FrmR family transcriptional regulator